jgi:hypothetical protein
MEGVIAVIAVIGPDQLSLISRFTVKFQTQTHKRKHKLKQNKQTPRLTNALHSLQRCTSSTQNRSGGFLVQTWSLE